MREQMVFEMEDRIKFVLQNIVSQENQRKKNYERDEKKNFKGIFKVR